MQFYKNKVVALTGAGSGMGREIARQLASAGASLAINDWNQDKLEETVQLLKLENDRILAVTFDVSKRDQVYSFAAKVVQQFGKVDVVINNAGITLEPHPMEQTSYEDFEKVVNINMWGMIYGTKAFLPYLRTRPTAVVANVSSVFGLHAYPGQGPYVTSKFAIRGFTETLRIELRKTNIRVCSIHPGGIKTNIVRNIDMPDATRKREIASNFDQVARTSASKAAQVILRGIEKGKKRILIGKDAFFLDRITRFFPTTYEKIILRNRELDLLTDEGKE